MNNKPNLIKFIEEPASEELLLVLRGHLYLEYLLNEIIDKTLAYPNELNSVRLGFYQKVKLLLALGKIDKSLSDLLLSLNKIRNSYAHQLDFQVDFHVAFSLVGSAATANIEFSDETIFTHYESSKELYGTIGILTEVISNTFQQLVWMNKDLFTEEEISVLLG